jgi:hypothetical protein
MVDLGVIRLHDAVLPALTADSYEFTIRTEDGAAGTMAATRYVSVEAPRFRIGDADVFSRFPMPGSREEVAGLLPWVAFGRRTLPWERRGADADPASPWLALVLTRGAEATPVTQPLVDVVGATAAASFGVDIHQPVPALRFANPAAMAAMLPTVPDVRLLAHAREVSLGDTEYGGRDDDGWVAVVVANRVPGDDDGEVSWRASVVSLEHRADIAGGLPQTAAVIAPLSWGFTALGGASFQTAVTGLDLGAFGGGVVLPRATHAGSVEPVRYRSPLSPPAADDDLPDATGSAAHELGRMIAAADGRVVAELVTCRRTRINAVARAVTAAFAAPAGVRGSLAVRALRPASPTARALRILGASRVRAAGPARLPARTGRR